MIRFKHPQNPLEVLGYGTEISDEHVRVCLNGDQALFRGFAKVILETSKEDTGFISTFTKGYEDYEKLVRNTSWEQISLFSGVERSEIERIGNMIAKSKATICCWAMGLTQHTKLRTHDQEISNLLLLGGHVGREGSGLCPVRGHSNVQGDRTVGINHNPTSEFMDSLSREFGIQKPDTRGLDSVNAVRSMLRREVRVFLSMGGNFISAMSDTNATSEAIRNCSLTVQISTKPNRSHLITGKIGIILPCLGRTERDESGVVYSL